MYHDIKQKKGFVIWIAGLSGSGKTTLANKFFTTYKNDIKNLIVLDGDNLREIFFSAEEKDRSYLKKSALKLLINILSSVSYYLIKVQTL